MHIPYSVPPSGPDVYLRLPLSMGYLGRSGGATFCAALLNSSGKHALVPFHIWAWPFPSNQAPLTTLPQRLFHAVQPEIITTASLSLTQSHHRFHLADSYSASISVHCLSTQHKELLLPQKEMSQQNEVELVGVGAQFNTNQHLVGMNSHQPAYVTENITAGYYTDEDFDARTTNATTTNSNGASNYGYSHTSSMTATPRTQQGDSGSGSYVFQRWHQEQPFEQPWSSVAAQSGRRGT